MMKKRLSSIFSVLLVITLIMCSFTGCKSSKSDKSTAKTDSENTATATKAAESTNSETADAVSVERQKVNFWYLWGGEEAKVLEKIISAYNESQDKYEVVGLSVPDQQKVLTGISGGEGPDITDDFGGSVAKYASAGIAMPLDDFMNAESFDKSAFIDAAFNQQAYEGKIYSLPISTNVYALYYNKDLMEKAGITELPKTIEELMDMCEKTTVKKGDEIEILGSPFVTDSYWYYSFTYAMGGSFGESADKLTPDNEGFIKSLDFVKSQVDKFGADAINNFVTSGNSKRYTPEDPFCTGKQAFRIDGPWFYNFANDAGINFGLTTMPGSSAQGGDGYSLIETSMVYIPATSKCPEGAWDFAKYISTGEGAEIFIKDKGDLPALKSLTQDETIINSKPSYEVYLSILDKNKLYSLPQIAGGADYSQNLTQAVQAIMVGSSVEDAKKQMLQSVANIQ